MVGNEMVVKIAEFLMMVIVVTVLVMVLMVDEFVFLVVAVVAIADVSHRYRSSCHRICCHRRRDRGSGGDCDWIGGDSGSTASAVRRIDGNGSMVIMVVVVWLMVAVVVVIIAKVTAPKSHKPL